MVKSMFLLVMHTVLVSTLHCTVLNVGAGHQYANVALAARDADPGDTILIHPGTYVGTFWIEDLHGTADSPIRIVGTDRARVVFAGGSESIHLSDVSYVSLERFSVTGQKGNGMNIDDGGTIETPTHHVALRDIDFFQMDALGNNDMLKLSGLDTFVIRNCTFRNGSAEGSGIDMVGCHHGVIEECMFENQGSNCIQAKGGTRFIRMEKNVFRNGFQRGINLGGSTGLQFFRPIDATFEAADLQVYSNVFIGGGCAVAFVGCERVDVANNTIIDPTRWIFRILQETVDPQRFVPCGNNWFRNNLVSYSTAISTQVNIGSNTDPESFTIANNLWFNVSNPGASQWSSSQLTQTASIYGSDPQLDVATGYRIPATSVAVGKGIAIAGLTTDIESRPFASVPSIGAYEGATVSSVSNDNKQLFNIPNSFEIYPNPTTNVVEVSITKETVLPMSVQISDVIGNTVVRVLLFQHHNTIDLSNLSGGLYIVTPTDLHVNSGKSHSSHSRFLLKSDAP